MISDSLNLNFLKNKSNVTSLENYSPEPSDDFCTRQRIKTELLMVFSASFNMNGPVGPNRIDTGTDCLKWPLLGSVT